jgi:hypothetical protein
MGLTNHPGPEAMPCGRNQLRRQMAGHSKGGQGLKRAVVPQKKKLLSQHVKMKIIIIIIIINSCQEVQGYHDWS